MKLKFKVGDRVKIVEQGDENYLQFGVIDYISSTGFWEYKVDLGNSKRWYMKVDLILCPRINCPEYLKNEI